MSHHDQQFLRVPKKRVLTANLDSECRNAKWVQLIVKGQGIVSFAIKQKQPFSWTITEIDGADGLRLEIAAEGATIYERHNGLWQQLCEYQGAEFGLDPDDDCHYWYSFDCHNRRIRYGKGETRLQTMLVNFDFPLSPEGGDDPYAWVRNVDRVLLTPAIEQTIAIWRDPITVEPALLILPTDSIAMDDVALNHATVPANLTGTCQVLYNNVSGPNFQLNTPDFPHFIDAIEASIRNPLGWCSKTLMSKANEFGDHNVEETYIRITMGVEQGDSPGIPYVMEIWPPGHSSPIHNHAGANAIIRVLSGEITVFLYSMLSRFHQVPFAQQIFRKDAVTWISPELNQVHKLYNHNKEGPTCITIQCYMYSDSNTTHYEYFDYISGDAIEPFTPNSDMGFLEFKALMKEEWSSSLCIAR